MSLDKELLEKNVAQINGQIPNALFEGGKNVGRLEGARDMLAQIVAMIDADKVSVGEAALKIAEQEPDTGAEAGEGQ